MDDTAAEQPSLDDFETCRFGDVTLMRGDCLEIMPTLAPSTIDMVFADLPYQILHHQWDALIDLNRLWASLKIISQNCAPFIFSSTQPFACDVIASQRPDFRYDLIFEKNNASGFLNAKRQPMRAHETLLVFYQKQPTYNPQFTLSNKPWSGGRDGTKAANYKGFLRQSKKGTFLRQPRSVLHNMSEPCRGRLHPTQKPVALLEWLIRTYTNDGDTILDPVAGSGTTAIAAMNVRNRKVICIEKDSAYFEIMTQRVANHQKALANAQA